MDAVILAAGVGSRLVDATGGAPKCLVEVGGQPLLHHHVDALRRAGVERIIIVVGHEADHVRVAAPPGCEFVVNEPYASTNSLYSLWLAREVVGPRFLLVNGDVLAHPDVYARVAEHPGSCLAFDPTSGQDEEHMKILLRGGRVGAMSKTLPASQTHGENVGILKFESDARDALFDAASALLASDSGRRTWAPAAVDRIAPDVSISAVDISDLPWVEVDFPADLHHAREVTWPSISAASTRATA